MSQGKEYGRDEVETLLRTALRELAADGTAFSDLSVGRLCTQAGMSRSTFYKYFDDKPAMLHALSATTLRRLYTAQRGWLAKGAEVTEADVHASMLDLLAAYLQDRPVLRAVAEASASDPTIGEAYRSAVLDYAGAIERLIRRGQDEGWAVPGLPPVETAEALAWMTERTTSQLEADASPDRLDRVATVLARTVVAHLRP